MNKETYTRSIAGLNSIRQFKEAILDAAIALKDNPDREKYIISLADSNVTTERLVKEYNLLKGVLQKEVLKKIVIAIIRARRLEQILGDSRGAMSEYEVNPAPSETHGYKIPKGGARYRMLKIILLHALVDNAPFTIKWLCDTAGCSYPIAAKFLDDMGERIERLPDRRLFLKWISYDDITRLHYLANHYRTTFRFIDRSGKEADYFYYIKRLQKIKQPGVALGGVIGAKHHYPDLDIINTPRLDLSLHSTASSVSLDFIMRIDPALEMVENPDRPADLAIHIVGHPQSLFEKRSEEGPDIADPIECLLDLYDIGLEAQTKEFFNYMKERSKNGKT